MNASSARVDLERFFERVERAARRLLMLDYDGTLAPFAPRRDQAFPYPGVTAILDGLIRSNPNEVVIISGRAVADLLPLLQLQRTPEIWGSHGWERLRHGERVPELLEIGEVSRRALDREFAWLATVASWDLRERKPASVALHWRALADDRAEGLRRIAADRWSSIAEEGGLELHPFDGGLELRVPGRNKGFVVETLLREAGSGESGGDVASAYLGDDLTDEDAFRSLGAKGLSVLVREEPRPTAARVWIRPPEELLGFLRRWSEASLKARQREG